MRRGGPPAIATRLLKRLGQATCLSGLAGGLAMIPPGLLLRRVLGYPLNVYGELLLKTVLGRAPLGLLLAEHAIISVAMAAPLVGLLVWRRVGHAVSLGVAYGAAIWLAVNSLALPLAFGRPSPWHQGWSAIWPSLGIHVVYGVVAAAVASRMVPIRS